MQQLPAFDEPSAEAPPHLLPVRQSQDEGRRLNLFPLVAWLFAAATTWLAYEHFGDQARVIYRVSTTPAAPSLAIPVQGVAPRAIVDSWHAPRGRGRKHEGIDIFAARGTPVVSPVTGIVTMVGQDRLGGNVVRVLGPGRQVHYFAHLDRIAPIRRWDVVEAGNVVGYVGNTGNARGASPHLHYGIYTAAAGAINPYPLLRPSR
jgi:murein DD-endopeptidase MepM/ murein hydrolase activator NlpD